MVRDDEAKNIIQNKGLCGEVFSDERGIRVVCILSCEQHHAEVLHLKELLAKAIGDHSTERQGLYAIGWNERHADVGGEDSSIWTIRMKRLHDEIRTAIGC